MYAKSCKSCKSRYRGCCDEIEEGPDQKSDESGIAPTRIVDLGSTVRRRAKEDLSLASVVTSHNTRISAIKVRGTADRVRRT